jgi:mono/diheme cytochrome c family protein
MKIQLLELLLLKMVSWRKLFYRILNVLPYHTTRFAALLIVFMSCFSLEATSASDEADILFVRRVLPLLQSKCLACHGDSGEKEGELSLADRMALEQGGASGEPLVIPGKAEQSPLFLAVSRESEQWSAMPPKETEKLTPQQLLWLKTWIEQSAPWPDADRIEEIRQQHAEVWSREDGVQLTTSGGLSEEWTKRTYEPAGLWAYKPVRKPEQIATASATAAETIDYWIETRLPSDLPVAVECDPETFIRRASYDLTGLPPTREAIKAFCVAYEVDSEQAVAQLVDRLLESPHYGERMAQHWLDVVRYADSAGFANDYERGNAWRYRDYVIRAFNQDLPYDRFVMQQIAGDEMEPENPDAMIATGFLRMGPWELTGMEVPKVARQRFLDDVTNIVGECFLAHSLQCARCHDHKFDPVPTRDYYSIQAAFSTTQLVERAVPFLESENRTGFEEEKYLQRKLIEYRETLAQLDELLLKNAAEWYTQRGMDSTQWEKMLAQARSKANESPNASFQDYFSKTRNALSRAGVPESDYPPKLVGFTTEQFGLERVARKGIERLRWELERYQPFALSVYSGPTPKLKSVTAPLRMPTDGGRDSELEQPTILIGGDPFTAGPMVAPGILSVIGMLGQSPLPNEIQGRRLALAKWIVHPQNPLTARVMVNRIWMWHFGIPIAGNPNNFGSTGKRPTHPELLDWLASSFIEEGWSMKKVHRWIMQSKAYRRSCQHSQPKLLQQLDPQGTTYAVFQPRRLSAEEIRDSMLLVSGELNLTLGGIPCRPEINMEAALQPRQVMGTFAAAWAPNPIPNQRHRRSVYVLRLRGLVDPALEVFNTPPLDFSCEKREVSAVTPQVFSLLNSENSYKRSLAVAQRIVRDCEQPNSNRTRQERKSEMVKACFERILGREATEEQLRRGIEHWETMCELIENTEVRLSLPPLQVQRDAIEENTGERFSFSETIYSNADFVPDLMPDDCDVETRALAELCLVLFNSNEFVFVY